MVKRQAKRLLNLVNFPPRVDVRFLCPYGTQRTRTNVTGKQKGGPMARLLKICSKTIDSDLPESARPSGKPLGKSGTEACKSLAREGYDLHCVA
jgi:hypothetical protein